MDINEANKIIEKYKESISRGTERGTVLRRISWLPCSKAKIKYAYFTVIEDIAKARNCIDPDLKKDLVDTYSLLDTFVDDLMVEKYVKIHNEWQEKKSNPSRSRRDEMLAKQYINYTYTLKGDDLTSELNEFFNDLHVM